MKKIAISFSGFFLFFCLSLFVRAEDKIHDYAPVHHDRENYTEEMHISRGGQLYDNWWRTTADTEKPKADHPLWKTQNSNKRSGYSTYRCKECHGWDYRGKEGAYGKGSHYTGFIGVYGASQKMSLAELEAILKGSTKEEHDFTGYLSNAEIADLALFINKGVINMGKYVNADGSPLGGDLNAGRNIFTKNCMTECHGPAGSAINFGSEEKPEFVGTVANENPWEFIHKVRAGQPGTRMVSGIMNKFSEKDIRDLLTYSRSLPKEQPETGWFDRMLRAIGLGEKEHKSYMHEERRGFGPKIEQ